MFISKYQSCSQKRFDNAHSVDTLAVGYALPLYPYCTVSHPLVSILTSNAKTKNC
jgi:hypothetical protein